jgi:hypothetical protein
MQVYTRLTENIHYHLLIGMHARSTSETAGIGEREAGIKYTLKSHKTKWHFKHMHTKFKME